MSHFLDRLLFFRKVRGEFAAGLGQTTLEDRSWEKSYRQRWQHDKIVRSTHGVNCTGACSWKIYVKKGLVTVRQVHKAQCMTPVIAPVTR